MKYVTFKDIDTLIEILQNIQQLYNDYYASLPSEDKPDKSTLEKTVDVLRYYAKIRSFVNKVMMYRERLASDLHYVHDKLHLLTAKENDMLFFYNLSDKYFEIKVDAERNKSKDSKYEIYFQMMDDYTLKFNEEVEKIGTASQALFNLSNVFTTEINQLQKYETESSILNALDKFDKILMLTIHLIELKIDMENALKNLLEAFEELRGYRAQINEVIDNMGRLNDHYDGISKIEAEVKASKKGVKVMITTVVCLVGLIM